MATLTQTQLDRLTRSLDEWGAQYDRSGDWPAKSVELLGQSGGWTWNIPAEFGGDPMSHKDRLRAYEALSAGCMSTALISTQRDGAVELLAASDADALKRELLPRLARGDVYTTVGISQLTTSKRGGGQLMKARPDGDGFRLDGMMPWATGAERADYIVTGAVLPNEDQILACVPTDRPGMRIDTPDELLTLTASRTSCVHCTEYRVNPEEILRGPAPKVLKLRTPVKPLVTSSCGIGVAKALYDAIRSAPPGARTPLSALLEPLFEQYQTARAALFSAADNLDDPDFEAPSTRIRVQVNDVLVRLAITALTVAKGSGFLLDRPIQRHVREALFFLVWSSPVDVQRDTLSRILGVSVGDADADPAL